jgi:hypothetical protein
MTKGTVNIKGKDYKLIVQRVQEFRETHPDWGMHSKVIHHDSERVIVKVWITDTDNRVRGTGLAEEDRSASRINQTSAMENCETSAFGRALASVGFGGDVAYASAEEVVNAINTQEQNTDLLDHMQAARDNWQSVSAIKQAIQDNDMGYACQLYAELGHDAQLALHKAPTKGGIFTTAERNYMRTNDWTSAMKEAIANG